MTDTFTVRGAVEAPTDYANPPKRVVAILDEVVPLPTATHATVVSVDGYRASIPLDTLRSGGTFSIEAHGLRLRVEEGATSCWNVKNVAVIDVTVGKAEDDIPARPAH